MIDLLALLVYIALDRAGISLHAADRCSGAAGQDKDDSGEYHEAVLHTGIGSNVKDGYF